MFPETNSHLDSVKGSAESATSSNSTASPQPHLDPLMLEPVEELSRLRECVKLQEDSNQGEDYRVETLFSSIKKSDGSDVYCMKITHFSQPNTVKIGAVEDRYRWAQSITLNREEMEWITHVLIDGTTPASLTVKDKNGYKERVIYVLQIRTQNRVEYLSLMTLRRGEKSSTVFLPGESQHFLINSLSEAKKAIAGKP